MTIAVRDSWWTTPRWPGEWPGQRDDLDADPAEIDRLAVRDRAVQGRVRSGRLLQPLPGRLVVVEAVPAVPAVALRGDRLPRLDPRPVLRRRSDARLRRDAPELAVAAVVVDVGVGDDHVGDVAGRAAELPQRRRDVLRDRPVDSGVDQQQPLVAGDEPLGEAAHSEHGGDPVDAGLDFLDGHGVSLSLGSRVGVEPSQRSVRNVKTAERTRIAFTRGTPDRVPIHCWLGLPLIKKLRPPDKSFLDLFEDWIDDPMGSIVKMQQDLGLDPMITTYSQHIGEHEIWPRMLFPRPFETETWVETFEETGRGDDWREHSHTIRTPDGDLDYSYRTEDGFGTSCHDFLLKGDEPETKLPALRHFPSADLYDMSVMRSMVEKVGDEAWWLHHVVGPWDMAAEIRGLVDLSTDIYDRPQFVHDLMRFCTDWLNGFYRRLGETGIHSISMNETWVGVGHRAGPLPRVHQALRRGVRPGRARGRLPRQLPQLRPGDAPARGHGRHRPRRDRDAHLRPLVGRRRPGRRQAPDRRTGLPLRRVQRAPASRRRTRTPSATRSGAASTQRWKEAATSCARPGRSSTRSPGRSK